MGNRLSHESRGTTQEITETSQPGGCGFRVDASPQHPQGGTPNMSGRHAGYSATQKRMFRIAAVSAVAVPLGVVAAGSACAGVLPAVPGLDSSSASSATDLLSSTPVGGLTGVVTGVL